MYTQATRTLNTTVCPASLDHRRPGCAHRHGDPHDPAACLRQRGLGRCSSLRPLGVRPRAVPAPRPLREVLAVPELCTLPEVRRLTLARHAGRPGARPAEPAPGRLRCAAW